MNRTSIRVCLATLAVLAIPLAQAKTLVVINSAQEVASVDIPADVPVEISGDTSEMVPEGKIMRYSGHARAVVSVGGKPLVIRAPQLELRP